MNVLTYACFINRLINLLDIIYEFKGRPGASAMYNIIKVIEK